MTALPTHGSFIRPEHLDIPEHFRVEASWLLAQNELIKVNNFKVGLVTCTILGDVKIGYVSQVSDGCHQSLP